MYKQMDQSHTQLNGWAQLGIFTLSPLIVPSLLCSFLLLLSLIDGKWLEVFSIPVIFSMVLVVIPIGLTGIVVSVMRNLIKLKYTNANNVIWWLSAFVIGSILSAKFMSWISLHLVGLAAIMGFIAALLACLLIVWLERIMS